jgi:hypothetical protein
MGDNTHFAPVHDTIKKMEKGLMSSNEDIKNELLKISESIDPTRGEIPKENKVITENGIVFEVKGDTMYITNIPQTEEYYWALISIKYNIEEKYPTGAWKHVINGETTYCLRDRGKGLHRIFIGFMSEENRYKKYTASYSYLLSLTEDNRVQFPL